MSLQGALSIAESGLDNISRGFGVVSQNVSNASTPGYTREVAQQSSATAGGVGMGVRTLPTTRDLNTQLQAETFTQAAFVSGLQTTQTALQGIDSVQGTPGGSSDLASLVGALQDAFSTLQTAPDSQTQQSKVVAVAQSLSAQVNALSTSFTKARQDAHDNIVTDIGTLNNALATIGTQSDAIIRLKAMGQSTADLENQRDAAMNTVANLVDTKFLEQPNGDMLVITSGGVQLPVHGISTPLTVTGANLAPGASYPTSVPKIMLGGSDVTGQLTGGSIGASIALRDSTLPSYQAGLDEFAETLSTRFDQQGLTLFTDPTGAVPVAGGTPAQATYVGYSAIVQVNPAVIATPSLVRDGTAVVAGSPTGASPFTPNPAGGPSGFTGMITRVLSYALGTQAQDSVAQPAPTVSGLGPTGTIAMPFAAPTDLAGFAAALVGAQGADSGQTTSDLASAQSVHASLQSKLDAIGAVSIDTEMSTMVGLQNAYGANARVITAVQSMWQSLMTMVP